MNEIVKNLISAYGYATLPLYYFMQKPQEKLKEAHKPRGTLVDSSSAASGWRWIRAAQSSTAAKELILPTIHQTLDTYFRDVFERFHHKQCLGHRRVTHEEDEIQSDGKVLTKVVLEPKYTWETFGQIEVRVNNLMNGFKEIGIKPKDVVVIFMETRAEWLLSFLALNKLGAVVATLYATLGDEGLVYGINLVESTTLISSASLLRKLKKVLPNLNTLTTIVYVESLTGQASKDIQSLSAKYQVLSILDLEAKGSLIYTPDSQLYKPTPEDTVVIMFTSGSTGTPKGVVIDHRGILESLTRLHTEISEYYENNEVYIGFLPLAHIFELVFELGLLSYGVSIGYSSPFTMTDTSPGLKEGSKGDISVLKPTVMAAVPLVLDKIRKAITDQVKQRGDKFYDFFEYAIGYKQYWRERGYETPMLNKLLFSKIKEAVGGRVKYLHVGGAPLSISTQEFIDCCLNLKILIGFGATETLGPVVANSPREVTKGCVGSPISGVQIKLVALPKGGYSPSDVPNPRGEIHVGTMGLARSYFKNSEATAEAFYEEDGLSWFKTGDIGEMLPGGTLKIIDRAKDLIKLAHGEYVSLGKVESELKNNPYVENICVYGYSLDTYIVALISPNLPRLKTLVNNNEQLSVQEICANSRVMSTILHSIKATAKAANLNKYETPKRIYICPEEWTPDSGLLTAAMKIRRNQIYDYYKLQIKSMYKLDQNRNQID